MQKLKGLNTLKGNLLNKHVIKNISYLMRIKRYYNGIDLKPEEFISIGKEFTNEMKNNNINRAAEVIGKYNEKTLNKIFDYNNPLMNINLNLNFPMGNPMKNTEATDNKEKTENKTTEDSNANKQEENKKKNINNFEIFNHAKSYQKIFTPEEIETIKEISADKEKLVEYLRANSLTLDSVVLKNNYAFSINLKGLKRENKLLYILLSLAILWLSYDAKGTFKCNLFFDKFYLFLRKIIENLTFISFNFYQITYLILFK